MNTLITLFWIAVAIALAMGAGWLFRTVAVSVTRGPTARALRTAPITAAFGMLVIVLYILTAIFAPVIAPYAERAVVGGQFLPWDSTHIFGTDNLGRDMFSRLIYGARNTVGIAFATTALAFAIGSILGLLAATVGGWIDQALSRLVDILMAIPSLIFSLLLLAIFGTSVVTLILVIATIDSTRVFRLARSVAMNIVVMDYIEAAKLRGEGLWRLITREILPNAMAPLVAEFGLRFCFVFLTIAALSFLGVGIQPPTADWGSMVRENAALITFGDVTPLLPAGAIALLTVAVNFVVDWMLHRASGLKE
ncbi:putative D,D-dipeptide transport system permease protein DdpC [Defluviimonas aquaemixtae]|uniref:Putative D,D-dipeptide transport system permease protein DdpC n=1 Tax=Albidovulum aquaemixtae TaxID=1542388 RepID=A0A2R8B5X0_9RHOB|nr:ABC transporter permease [Defluviimonas aquaemixtae]SPH18007.1 putative D,D-dipeptide transport system permease protein DdpC [Defluviimonas aquaemixtae]